MSKCILIQILKKMMTYVKMYIINSDFEKKMMTYVKMYINLDFEKK